MDIATIMAWFLSIFDAQFLALLIATVVLFCVMYVTWLIYRTLSKRNIFQLKRQWNQSKVSGWDRVAYYGKYLFIFPMITFLGFIVFAFSLFILIKPASAAQQGTVLFIAIVVVSTIRVAAHVSELMAEDLAKLVPLSMLAVLLSHPSITGIGVSWEQIATFVDLIPSFVKYLIFTILLEAVLRAGGAAFSQAEPEEEEVRQL